MVLSYLYTIMGSCLSRAARGIVYFISSLCIIEPKFIICIPWFWYLTINANLVFSFFFSSVLTVFPVCIFCSNLIGMWLSLYESSKANSPIFFISDFLHCGVILRDSFIAWLRYSTDGRTDRTLQRAAWSQLRTTGHLFCASSSFVHHFGAICEFKLESKFRNTHFKSKLAFFAFFYVVWPWN